MWQRLASLRARATGAGAVRTALSVSSRRAVCGVRWMSAVSVPLRAEAAAAAAAATETATAKPKHPPSPANDVPADVTKPYAHSAAPHSWQQWQELKALQQPMYDQVDLYVHQLKAAEFFPDVWTANYNAHNPLRRSLRALVAENTRRLTRELAYNTQSDAVAGTESLVRVTLSAPLIKQTLKKTKVYESTHKLKLKPFNGEAKAADIRVVNGDALDCAYDLKRAGYNPLLLDPVTDTAGSLWLRGGGAGNGGAAGTSGMDEDFWRRTTIGRAVRNHHFPLTDAGAIYSPNVIVFRGGAPSGFRLLAEPYTMSFAALSQYRRPRLGQYEDGTYHLSASHVLGLKRKFRSFLRLAAHFNHNAVVMPAFGGANYKNPPRHVASVWKAVFEEEEFAGRLPAVRFAIADDFEERENWQPDGTLRPYLEVFGAEGTTGFVPPAIFAQPK